MVDYLTAQEIQDYFSRGMTSITVEVMPRLTDEAKDLLEKIDFQILVRSPEVMRKKFENHIPQMENSPKRKPFKEILQEEKKLYGGDKFRTGAYGSNYQN